MAKVCPILSAGALAGRKDDSYSIVEIDCIEHRCQQWTMAYTTESVAIWGCAHTIKAMTNKDGLVVV